MSNTKTIKRVLGLPSSTNGKEALNKAIRRIMPGGAEILDLMYSLSEMQQGLDRSDPTLQSMINKLNQAHAAMGDVLKDKDKAEELIRYMTSLHDTSIHAPARKRLGPPLAEDRIDWDSIDWSKANAQLGRELGVSAEAVRKQRKKLNKPAPAR